MPEDQPSRSVEQRDSTANDRPVWRNAPETIGFRSYGGNDARLLIEGDRLRLMVRGAKTFVAVFGLLFIPAFALIAWFAIPDFPTRLFFAVGGSLVGIVTLGLIYGLMEYHERLGDYLVIDRAAQVVQLPRSKAQFPMNQVFGLQLIRGRSKTSSDVETDLNLLVADGSDLVRYHVMGSPSRAQIEQIAQFSGLPLKEPDLGHGGYRDADSDSS